MKKFWLLFSLVLVASFLFVSAAFAADEAWAPFVTKEGTAEKMECTIVDAIGPNKAVADALPAISSDDWSIGPDDAVLTILEYADFQCPYCSNAGLQLLDFQKKHPDEVRYIYRHFPLTFHEKAPMAAYAADAAGKQGLFFDAEHMLYVKQSEWSALTSLDEFETWLKDNFKVDIANLDYDKWLIDFADADLRAKVDAAFDEVVKTGIITGTPTIFLNMNSYKGALDEESLGKYLELFKLQTRLYADCPPNLIEAEKQYRAIVNTTKGQFVIDLFADKAPLAVNNFIYLAQEGWFDGIKFHRIVPGFVVQSGDPSNTGLGVPGYNFADEPSDLKYGEPGLVGMANSGPNKNGSQFFITFDLHEYFLQSITKANDAVTGDNKLTDEMIEAEVQKQLDTMSASYTIFGKVSEGFEQAENLTASDTILSVKIEQK